HSAFDFGLHIPAIALLATVLCAHLCALGSAPLERGDGPAARRPAPGALLAAGAALALALVLGAEGWRAAPGQPPRRAAISHGRAMPACGLDGADGGGRVALLTKAAELARYSARLQAELGQAYLDVFEAHCQDREEGEVVRGYLTAGLRHYLRARDLFPLLPKPHVQLAAYVNAFEQAEGRAAYLDRAKVLVPGEPDLWDWCGVLELMDGRPDEAWKSWRHSLELHDVYAPEILDVSVRFLSAEKLRDELIPDDPRVLVTAALHLYPGRHQEEERGRLFEKA